MNFKKYFIISIGDITGIREEIDRISESELKYIESTNTSTITFKSAFTPAEIKEFLNQVPGRSFMIFEMNDQTSAISFSNVKYNKLMTGKSTTTTPFPEFKLDASSTTGNVEPPIGNTEEMVIKSEIQRTDYINKLLDKGYENLTEDDKKVLSYLTNNG